MAELLPCPHCGESKLLEVEEIDHGEEKRPFGFRWTAKVICLNCSASCGAHRFLDTAIDARRVAISAWNRRTSKERCKNGFKE